MGKEAKKEEVKKPKDAAADKKPMEDGRKKKQEEEVPPPTLEEVEMRVYMHCNCKRCVRKVKKILRHFDGVEDVIADSEEHKVVVKAEKVAADPMKVVEHVQKKNGRKVELVLPIPPLTEEEKEEEKKEVEPPKPKEGC